MFDLKKLEVLLDLVNGATVHGPPNTYYWTVLEETQMESPDSLSSWCFVPSLEGVFVVQFTRKQTKLRSSPLMNNIMLCII